MGALYEVVRPFKAAGVFHDRGERVDVDDWPQLRAKQMTDQRFIKPLVVQLTTEAGGELNAGAAATAVRRRGRPPKSPKSA